MYIINRSAIIVRLKQPYVDWANALDESEKYSLNSLNRENHIYLIEELESDEEYDEIIKDIYADIFEIELASWVTDKALWPKNRDYKTFKQWFMVEPHSTVFDMLDEAIEEEE